MDEQRDQIQAQERSRRAVRTGTVVSAKMDKTCVIKITRKVRNPLYGKYVTRSTKLYVHDEENSAQIGDTVRVMSMRPMSKLKRWRLMEVLQRAE